MNAGSPATAQEQLIDAIEGVLKETSQFLKRYGVDKSGVIGPVARARLLTWPTEKLERTLASSAKILKVHLDAEKEAPDFDIDDSSRLLLIALKELGLSIDKSFYSMIDRTNVVEVYDNHHFQVFRSFNFFRLCNYNLDDVLSHEWFELYERNQAITDEIMAVGVDHIQSDRTITKIHMKPHLMRERFSEVRGSFISEFKYFASIYSGPERKHGYIVVTNAKPVGATVENVDFISGDQKITNAPVFGNPI
jgi:hypothetical protein